MNESSEISRPQEWKAIETVLTEPDTPGGRFHSRCIAVSPGRINIPYVNQFNSDDGQAVLIPQLVIYFPGSLMSDLFSASCFDFIRREAFSTDSRVAIRARNFLMLGVYLGRCLTRPWSGQVRKTNPTYSYKPLTATKEPRLQRTRAG